MGDEESDIGPKKSLTFCGSAFPEKQSEHHLRTKAGWRHILNKDQVQGSRRFWAHQGSSWCPALKVADAAGN